MRFSVEIKHNLSEMQVRDFQDYLSCCYLMLLVNRLFVKWAGVVICFVERLSINQMSNLFIALIFASKEGSCAHSTLPLAHYLKIH